MNELADLSSAMGENTVSSAPGDVAGEAEGRTQMVRSPASNTPNEPWHGTTGGYTNHRCRCTPCRAAHRDNFRARRGRGHRIDGSVPHGTEGGYNNYACRCELCRTAHRDTSRAYRLRTRTS
jgi:hypothetical protein